MRTRKTLEERIVERREKFRLQSNMIIITAGHIRAEFNRLARVIGRLKCGFPYNKYEHAIQDVERLLKEAKR